MYMCKHGHVCICIYYGYIVILYNFYMLLSCSITMDVIIYSIN